MAHSLLVGKHQIGFRDRKACCWRNSGESHILSGRKMKCMKSTQCSIHTWRTGTHVTMSDLFEMQAMHDELAAISAERTKKNAARERGALRWTFSRVRSDNGFFVLLLSDTGIDDTKLYTDTSINSLSSWLKNLWPVLKASHTTWVVFLSLPANYLLLGSDIWGPQDAADMLFALVKSSVFKYVMSLA